MADYLSWKTARAGSEAMKDLEQFLLDRAMEHDSPTLLFSLAAEYLISARTIRPGVVIVVKMVASARTGVRALTWEKVVHLLTGQLCDDLDRLLMADAGLAVTRLAWLTTPAVDATAAAVKTASEKLTYLRNMDAHTLDLSMLPTERRRFLATVANGRIAEVRAGDRLAGRREVVGRFPAEHPGGRAQGGGTPRRTIHAARYLSDPAYRRRIGRQLNKGEPLPSALYQRWASHFGVDVLDGIGMTEMLHIFLSSRPGAVRPGTTGVAVPG